MKNRKWQDTNIRKISDTNILKKLKPQKTEKHHLFNLLDSRINLQKIKQLIHNLKICKKREFHDPSKENEGKINLS